MDVSELTLGEGEACCYEHSTSRAVALCSNCGRFLCRLCEVQLGTQVFCPDCVQSYAGASRQSDLVTQRTKFDSIALALALWPLLVFYFTIVTAPLSLVMAIYAWKRPTSIVRRSRWRVFVAIGVASLEIAGMTALIFTLVYAAKRRS